MLYFSYLNKDNNDCVIPVLCLYLTYLKYFFVMAKKTWEKINVGSLYDIKGRHYFTDDRSVVDIPSLIEVQLDSYKDFLEHWIEKVFSESFPISDHSWEKVDIYYKGHFLEEPKYDPVSCTTKNLTYEAPLKVRFEMLNKETWEIKEQDVYMWGIPLMTEQGSFIVNWIERIIVNQIIRSTWVFFTFWEEWYALKFIPAKWSWFEIDIEKRWIINVKIDKKRKLPVTVLLRAFWLESNSEIIDTFKDLWDEIIANNIAPTIEKDKTTNKIEAWHVIYKLLRPGDLATDERVEELFNVTFFDEKRFDLWEVARVKMKTKLWIEKKYSDEDWKFLNINDIIVSLKYFLRLTYWAKDHFVDDIDHLENRRVRSVWELVMDKLKVWIARMERITKDRMTIVELDEATPGTFINSRPIVAILKEFFGSSQLSQFMD